MARKPRIHVPGGVYHVMLRGNGGQAIFSGDEDYAYLYGLFDEGTQRFGYRIHAFCCMPNHLHLAVQVGEIPLSRALQNVAFRYTRWINRRMQRVGHLFQGRYKAILVDRDSYLLELVRYIHLNPVRAGLVGDAEAYPWSGHRVYLGRERLSWLTTDWVLGHFGERVGTARRRYQRFVSHGLDEGHRSDFHAGPEDPRVLGDARFTHTALSCEEPLHAAKVTVDQIIAAACQAYGLAEEELMAGGQGRRATEVRAAIAWLATELRCATLAEVGRRVRREGSSLSSAARRLRHRAADDTPLATRLDRLRDVLLARVATCQA